MSRVLVVDGAMPARQASAGERATFDLLDGLVATGHDVVFTTIGSTAEDSLRVGAVAERGVEVPAGYGHGEAGLRSFLASGPWHAVFVNRPGPALVASEALRGVAAARIYLGHDIHQWRLLAQNELVGDVPSHLRAVTEIAERRCWGAYDVSVYPTLREADHVNAQPGLEGAARALPYYRLTDQDLPPVIPRPDRRGLLVVGASAHAPNRDAAAVAVRDVLPLVAEPLSIVGDWPMSERASLAGDRVWFTCRVTDDVLIELHHRHLALLSPLRFGAGSRRKLVAAMGLGLPVITTSEGARGLLVRDAEPDDAVLIAETPAQMAEAVRRLRAEPDWADEIAARAQHVVRDVYAASIYDQQITNLLADYLPPRRSL